MAGERVLAEVRASLRHLDEAARIATTPDTGTRLRIACTPFFSMWVTVQLLTPYARHTRPQRSRSPSAISRIIDGTMVSIAADILPEGAIPGLAVRRVGDPVRWRWATTMLREAPKPSSVAFTNWARLRG